MSSNPDEIVQQMQRDFQSLIAYVSDAETPTRTAAEVECTLFRPLLALGLGLLRLFFVTRAAVRPTTPIAPTTFQPIPYHDRRPIDYFSVFGKLSFARQYFYAGDIGGVCPLHAALSLPARSYSDLLRDWSAYDSTDGAYRETSTTIARILGWDLSTQSLERMVLDDACDVAAFSDRPPAPTTRAALGSILVAQADGKGIPMVQPPAPCKLVRLGKGQKRTKKKEAIVTPLYTIAPYLRRAQDVVSALLHDPPAQAAPRRPQPVGKEVRATLDGKAAAISKLAQRADVRAGAHIRDRVALTDGAEALQQQMTTCLPDYTLVLDIIHATQYLWDTANALLGETHAGRSTWIRPHLEHILAGQTGQVIAALQVIAGEEERSATQRAVVRKTIGYYERNLPYMAYDTYLARGWPIGTGVVGGACGHVVKDRMEQASLRWTKAGAQAMLDLRAVRLNNDWDAYWQFHRQQEHERLYGTAQPVSVRVESQALQLAA